VSTQFSGILEIDLKRFGFIRPRSAPQRQTAGDPYVPPSLITKYNLRAGVLLEGTVSPKQNRSPEVEHIETVNGLGVEEWKVLKEFSQHEVISPFEHIRLEAKPKDTTDRIGHTPMRIVDLFCPIGKGQRALIVSPPKAGKTMLMQQLARAISYNNPEIDLLVLLIDERPEEVTDMRRTIKGEVFASSSDSERGEHVRLAQLVLEFARRKVETGKDVVILLDSLTRLGRAFNIHQKSSGRTMSGGGSVGRSTFTKRAAAEQCRAALMHGRWRSRSASLALHANVKMAGHLQLWQPPLSKLSRVWMSSSFKSSKAQAIWNSSLTATLPTNGYFLRSILACREREERSFSSVRR
jgi:transcription termination factor Rho